MIMLCPPGCRAIAIIARNAFPFCLASPYHRSWLAGIEQKSASITQVRLPDYPTTPPQTARRLLSHCKLTDHPIPG